MRNILRLIGNLIIPIILFFVFGLTYIVIFGTSGRFDNKKVLILETLYFFIGIIHSYIYIKSLEGNYKIIAGLIILFVYFYLAFIVGQ